MTPKLNKKKVIKMYTGKYPWSKGKCVQEIAAMFGVGMNEILDILEEAGYQPGSFGANS